MNILALPTKSKIEEIGIFGRKVTDLTPQEKDKLIEILYDEVAMYTNKYVNAELAKFKTSKS